MRRADGTPSRHQTSEDTTRGSTAGRALREAGIALGFVVLAALLFAPVWSHPDSAVIGGRGDPQQTMWFLQWTPWALTHAENPFITSYINAPAGVNLMWNSAAPLLGVVLWPVTLGFGLVVAYNAAVTAGVALSGYCAYRVGRRFLSHRASAIFTGVAYAICPFIVVQSGGGHGKIALAFAPPLLLLLLDGILVRRRRPADLLGIGLGALMSAQLLIFEEGVGLALVAATVGITVLAILEHSEILPRAAFAIRSLGWAVAMFLVICAVPLAVQWFGPGRIDGPLPGGSVYIIDIANLVLPTSAQLLAPEAATSITAGFSGNLSENDGYLGIAMIAVIAVVAVRHRRVPLVRWGALTGAVLVILTLGRQVHLGGQTSQLLLPWVVVEKLPVIGSLFPSRLFIYVDLLAALACGLLADDCFEWVAGGQGRRTRVTAAVVALGAVLVSDLPGQRYPTVVAPVPSYFTGSGVRDMVQGATALVVPFVQGGPSDDAMLWQAASKMRFRMPEGYFIAIREGMRDDGPAPSTTRRVLGALGQGTAAAAVSTTDRQALAGELHQWNVERVLVGPTPNQAEFTTLFTELLGPPVGTTGGVTTWMER